MKILVFDEEKKLDAYVGETICDFIRQHDQQQLVLRLVQHH